MNKITIDLDAVMQEFEQDFFSDIIKRRIERHVIKPVYCGECNYFKNNIDWCIHNTCAHNPINTSIDYFTVKECEHDWLYSTSGKVDARRKCNKCELEQWSKFNE